MTRSTLLIIAALALLPAGAAAQAHGTHSSHAGKEVREIKALSNEEVEGFLAGRGMGLAIAAEMNRYPGPRHVLDLAEELGLSEDQAVRIRAIFAEMHRQAVSLGREYVEHERELDRLFVQRTIDEAKLSEITAGIGRLQGELRNLHLRAHLRTAALLTPEQIRHYDVHRGYSGHAAGRKGDTRSPTLVANRRAG